MHGCEVVADILMAFSPVVLLHMFDCFDQFRLTIAEFAKFGGHQLGKGSVGGAKNRAEKNSYGR